MSAELAGHLEDYLRLRRALGFKLRFEGQALPQFVAYLDAIGAQSITVEAAVAWTRLSVGVQPVTLSHRLGAVRGFARYLATIDPATEIPPCGLFGKQQRRTPYIYSPAEIARLLAAAGQLRPPLRAATPLTPHTVKVLRVWLRERRGAPSDPLFPTRTGTRMSRDAVEHRLAGHLAAARTSCPSLHTKRIGMHTLRHSAAMRLLEAGTDVTIIALWLGHEQPATTAQIYLHADMSHKQRAIDRVAPPGTTPGRYRPPHPLLAFLESL